MQTDSWNSDLRARIKNSNNGYWLMLNFTSKLFLVVIFIFHIFIIILILRQWCLIQRVLQSGIIYKQFGSQKESFRKILFLSEKLHWVTNTTIAILPTQTLTWPSFAKSWNKLSSWTKAPLYLRLTKQYLKLLVVWFISKSWNSIEPS